MKLARVLFGAVLGLLLVAILWFAAILPPPEPLSRRAAVWAATAMAADDGRPIIERIPCPVLRKLRFYAVCTDDCESIWRIVGVWGLQPRILSDLGRIPPERPAAARHRINTAVEREDLTLDLESGREMIGCYMRLDGLYPELILPAGGRSSVRAARGSEKAMLELERRIMHPEGLSRLEVRETAEGFVTRFDYWDTALPEKPILELEVRIGRDGRLLGVERRVVVEGAGFAPQ